MAVRWRGLVRRIERAFAAAGIAGFNKGSAAKLIRKDPRRAATVEDLPGNLGEKAELVVTLSSLSSSASGLPRAQNPRCRPPPVLALLFTWTITLIR